MGRIKDLWESYKVVVILDLVLLFLFLVILAGETFWSISVLEKPQFYESRISGTDLVAHIEYPSQILYLNDQPHTLNIWFTCAFLRQKCPTDVVISSGGKNLLFSANQDVPRWTNALDIPIQPDQKAVAIQIARTNAVSWQTLNEQITITASGATPSRVLPELQLEGKQNAAKRLWFTRLAGQAGVFISILGIPITWLFKQLDDEKKRQKRAQVEETLNQFEDDSIHKPVLDFLNRWADLQKDWPDWTGNQHSEFGKKFRDFLNGSFLSQSGEELDNIEEILATAKKLYGKLAPSEPNNVLYIFEKALENSTEAVYKAKLSAAISLFRIDPKATKLVSAIIEQIPENARKTTFDEIEIAKTDIAFPLASRQLKDMFGFPVDGMLYSPDQYPFEHRLDIISSWANPIEQDGAFQAWLNKRGLKTSPFFDAKSPYAKAQIDLRDTVVGLFQNHYKFGPNRLVFQNDWDLRAGFYDYCRSRSNKGKIFYVLLSPAFSHGYENAVPKEIVLHALAREWLYTLTLDDFSFFELNATLREALCRLLVWHCGSVLVLKMTIEEIRRSYGKITYKKMENLLEIISQMLKGNISIESLGSVEMNVLAGFRPAHTFDTHILCPSIDLDNQRFPGTSTQQITKSLDAIASWLKTLHTDIIYFISDDSQPGVRLSEDDLVELCNRRLVICSDKKINGLDELFTPHMNEPAELLLARKAHGSPGEMIRLGQTLLLNHCRNHPGKELLDIQELLELKA